MKKQKGITLMSLVIYIIVMMIVLVTLMSIVNKFNENNQAIQADTKDIVEFNKFNTYFLKEIKSINNKIDEINDNYILFSSGNSFNFIENAIYYNNIKICTGVDAFIIQQGKNGDGQDENIVYVTVEFKNFTKSMNYKIEEIY